MLTYLKSRLGRFRLLGILEGGSLLLLVFVAMPLKYGFDMPGMVKILGPIHGVLFILFVVATILISIERNWSFFRETIPVLLSSLIPFGTMYVDWKILRKMDEEEKRVKKKEKRGENEFI